MSHVRTLRELDYHSDTDSLLLGYEVASADTERGRLSIVASGKQVRFALAGHDGYVALDLTNYASAAYSWLTRDDDAPVVAAPANDQSSTDPAAAVMDATFEALS